MNSIGVESGCIFMMDHQKYKVTNNDQLIKFRKYEELKSHEGMPKV